MTDFPITVVIALYNKEKYIKKCIDSVLSQSYGNFKVIIVNDGSTDGSFEIAKSYTDDRITLIDQTNRGPGVARNRGLSVCETKYISFLDADDDWHPDFITKGLEALENNADCDLFLCGSVWQPLEEIRLPFFSFENIVSSGSWILPLDLQAEDAFNAMNFFATGAVMAKTSVIKKYGGYFDAKFCNSGEDGYLWVQVMFNHKIYRSVDCLLYVNVHGSDLGIGRKAMKPVPPILLYPDQVYGSCPDKYKHILEKLLAFLAFQAFRRELYQNHFAKAYKLYKRFPKLANYKTPDYPPIIRAFIEIPYKRYVVKPINYLSRKRTSYAKN
jgi:glycosyltransferase involved in cell wall biosynthesis